MTSTIPVTLHVNGEKYALEVPAHKTLLKVLREDLGLPGTKSNCGEGECGACTVLVDGEAVNSCLLLAVRAQNTEITTIEGIGDPEHLHPVQNAFIEAGSIQCGYCTPGFIMSTVALLDENPHPSREEMVNALSGNICRCTGYVNIERAVVALGEQGGKES
jgi:carbon-monoxide dehydrogenase small subunit